MIRWLIQNLSTLIVLAVVIAVVSVIIVKLLKDKKAGKSSCGCHCSDCPMSGKCH